MNDLANKYSIMLQQLENKRRGNRCEHPPLLPMPLDLDIGVDSDCASSCVFRQHIHGDVSSGIQRRYGHCVVEQHF